MTWPVVVVGGGLAGALVARALDRRGVGVAVVDAGEEPGGISVPIRLDGYLLEPAAGTLMLPHPHLSELLDGLDIGLRPATPASRTRLIYHRGRVHAAPGSVPSFLMSGLLSPAAKLRAAAEVFAPARLDPDESLTKFMKRRFGREAGELGAWLAAAGVHAGDPERLSVGAAFPMLESLEQQQGSVVRALATRRSTRDRPRPESWVVEGGMASVASGIADTMGDRWRRSFHVGGLTRSNGHWSIDGPERLEAERVVLAVDTASAGHLLGQPTAGMLARCESSPVAVVWLGLSTPLPDAIGILVGPDDGFGTLGFLFESVYAPQRSPGGRGLVKAIVGGACRPEALEQSDEHLVAQVATELGLVLGSAPAVEMAHVVRHRRGIPQYTSERAGIVSALPLTLPRGVSLAGWEYDGVGLSHLATAAATLASRLSA
ncbi:protoporphyrinogen oxidase [soil metagenome]